MYQKIKKLVKSGYFKQFADLRYVFFLVFGVVVLLVSWSGVGVIQTNYQLQKQIFELEQQNQVYRLESENLRLKNQYLNTDQYLELQARRQFGKALPGETLVLIPKEVALKYASPAEVNEQPAKTSENVEKPFYQENFEAWMDFLLRRPNRSINT